MSTPEEPALAEFAQAYLKRLPDDYVDAIPTDELYAQVRSVFEFVSASGTEPIALRVFHPKREIHGYATPGAVVEVVAADSPFLIDSVTEALQSMDLSVQMAVHPVIGTVRSPDGALVDVRHARGSERRESVQHYELDRSLTATECEDLCAALRLVLEDVRLAVRDFGAMRDAVYAMAAVAREGEARYTLAEIEEAEAFLEWLRDDNFVFLGFRQYRIVDGEDGPALAVVPGSGLGILSRHDESSYAESVPLASLPPDLRSRYESGFLLVVSKTNSMSSVHRRARMDYVGVRHVGPDGTVIGEARLLGLFTSRAYMAEAASIPILRRKLRTVLAAEDLIEGSHDHKAVIQIFNSFPKEELFSNSIESIRQTMRGLLTLEEREHVKVFVRPDLLHRSVALMVVLPRDRFSAELRQRLQSLFKERYGGSSVDYRLALGESGPARIHFTVWVAAGEVPDVPLDALEAEVVELARTWEDRLGHLLSERLPAEEAFAVARRWSARLPDYYKAATSLDVAVGDITMLEKLAAGDGPTAIGLQNEPGASEQLTRLGVYRRGGKFALSEIMPVLEAMGLRVVEEVPTRLADGDAEIFIHDFGVLGPDGEPLDLAACGDRVAETVAAVLDGDRGDSDSLDRLVITSGLDHFQVGILRAYRSYWRRVSPVFPAEYVNDAFAAHPAIAAKLWRLFELRFDPALADQDPAPVRDEIVADLDAVRSLDEDRILRGFLGLIEATTRTNVYRPGRGCLSFKLRSDAVPEMPDPRPLFEIFVFGPSVEGVHLRGGMVARGGIRWSDRREDYRAEVLGLMKAQMTKNAVIVPTGSKGGFVLRQVPAEAPLDETVRKAYSTFMRAMLDVTDNLVEGEIIHPPGVRIHDGPDPYLVVAADRGTARLSDTANRIAEEYGFWLGDAFASGGSAGYDHKALGITARGAWESVRRHFLDLGIDAAEAQLRVAGIGDMSGDVFGNGMLRSDQIQLVAAFDHRLVFIDPAPDPEASFKERQRLFEMGRSTWDDYDRSVISEGGGVYARSAKQITLSHQARSVLGTEQEALTPSELIRAILRAPVDLIWNGGIGTYVKAATESHDETGDRSNDAVRVNGSELACRVFAEGGNLGLTQRGRIEYAAAGGRINTDAIDNSGGVDCSDREVNLKILLRLAEERGELEGAERGELVAAVVGDVTDRVVENNFLQAQLLSQEVRASAERLEAYGDLMQVLERDGLLDRQLEFLPQGDELVERAREGLGMLRPELGVLMGYSKRHLTEALLASDLPDWPDFLGDLAAYFPEPVVKRFGHLVGHHSLRREIVAMSVANQVVNSEGITFVNRLVTEAGSSPAEVVRAYRIARALTRASERWHDIEELDGVIDPALHDELLEGVDWLVEAVARWHLRRPATGTMGETIVAADEAFGVLVESIGDVGSQEWRADRDERVATLVENGVPAPVARRHIYQDELVHAPDIIEVAGQTGRSIVDVARVFFLVGQAYHIDWLEARADQLSASNRWERWAARTLETDLAELRSELAGRVLAEATVDVAPAEAVAAYRRSRPDRHARLAQFMQLLTHEGGNDFDSLSVAVRQISALAG